MVTQEKIAVIALLLFCIVGGLSSADFFTGIGPDASAYTRNGTAVGGSILFGFDLNPKIATGVKGSFFHNMDTIISIEPTVFFRFYPLTDMGLFIQANAGGAILIELGEWFPSAAGGLTAGWRSRFARNWFVEPFGRFGYPYMWGAGLTAGYLFR